MWDWRTPIWSAREKARLTGLAATDRGRVGSRAPRDSPPTRKIDDPFEGTARRKSEGSSRLAASTPRETVDDVTGRIHANGSLTTIFRTSNAMDICFATIGCRRPPASLPATDAATQLAVLKWFTSRTRTMKESNPWRRSCRGFRKTDSVESEIGAAHARLSLSKQELIDKSDAAAILGLRSWMARGSSNSQEGS
jgi:hypothetical protein